MNSTYLAKLRSDSAYPVFRKVVGIATGIGYFIAGSMVFGAIMPALTSHGEPSPFVIGMFLVAAFVAIMARVGKEVSLMIADIADATLDSASRRPTE